MPKYPRYGQPNGVRAIVGGASECVEWVVIEQVSGAMGTLLDSSSVFWTLGAHIHKCVCLFVQAWHDLALDGSNWQHVDLFDFQMDIVVSYFLASKPFLSC